MAQITSTFAQEYFELLEETFEQVHGTYLDRGTSLFETLDTISAEMASRPVSDNCASIAAQVEHIRYYLDVLAVYMQGQKPENVDWKHIWRTVRAVTPQEWETSISQLRASYHHILSLMKRFDTWEGENEMGGALAVLVHTAYHLGEIRQALCTIKQQLSATN
ncbi:MAG: DinB family protein [Chloroflexi bacterium]|nr:DinB family protein [Chloroflexota bacterium]